MDQSGNQSMNATQLQQDTNTSQFHFLDGIESYGASSNLQSGNNEYADFSWDPALFDNTNLSHGFNQQTNSTHSPYDSDVNRQSHSPALAPYHSSQATYSQQHQPSQAQQHQQQQPPAQQHQPLYNGQTLSQQPYDPRFYRPSASPVSLDQSYTYPQYMGYPQQNYGQQSIGLSMSRQTSTSTLQPNYQPRQQQMSQYLSASHGQSQLSQSQHPEMIHFSPYHETNQQHPSTFVNPTLLSASTVNNLNGDTSKFQPHQFIHSPYFSPQQQTSTLDPRSLQPNLQQRPIQQAVQSVQPQPASLIHAPVQIDPALAPAIPKPTKTRKPRDPNAPKKPRAPRKKENLAEVQKDGQVSLSDTDSSSGSEDEVPPEMTPAVLVVSPPSDERGKTLYNAVQAVWSPRNRLVPSEKLRTGVVAFGDTARALRDSWKAKNDELKKAELPNSISAASIPKLKEDVSRYRQVMEDVIARSLQFGHPAIIRSLGENQFIMSALYSFLLDRFTVGDYDSTLVSTILNFASKFETLDEEMLEMTKWTKILQRFVKKATNESKSLAQSILTNATTASAKKKTSTSKPPEGPASPAGSATGSMSKDVVAGVKRSSDGEPVGPVAKKAQVKAAVQSSKPLALQRLEKQRAEEALKIQNKPAKSSINGTASTAVAAGKTKVALAAPAKSGVLSSLVSAPKKSGIMTAQKPIPPKKEESTASLLASLPRIKKEPTKRDSPPPRAAPTVTASKEHLSFLGYLADMDKKEEVEPKKEDLPDETQEEKKKRLRKEARRKLRVSWKPDDELVDTRVFSHFPEEETGQTDSMMRDAGDTVKEGEMLKLHKGMADLDDDEEDESAIEELAEYIAPSDVDFGIVQEEISANYIKGGGPVKPDSTCSMAQTKHEANTVMAVFATKTDRPPTPAEPNDNGEEPDFQPTIDFGDPNEKIRARERDAVERKRQQQQPSQPAIMTNFGATRQYDGAGSNLAAALAALTQNQQQQAQQAPIQQPSQQFQLSDELRRALGLSVTPAQPPPPPPQSQSQAAMVPDLSKLMAVVQQVTANRQQPPPPQPVYQAPVILTQSQPSQTPNLSALLAQFTSAQTQTQTQTQSQPQPVFPITQSLADDYSRKHMRGDSYDDAGIGMRAVNNPNTNKKKKGIDTQADGNKPYNYKTLPCSFWKEGKCIKGDNCTYRHDE